MRVLAGTSGYAYKEWKGHFYPEDLPNNGMLGYYAQQFDTVEINNTFYRMPSQQVLVQWAEQVPADFSFVLKASRRITHQKRLKDADEPLSYVLENAAVLGPRLGLFLFQLPPNLKKDTERLRDFVQLLPEGSGAAFEFRHVSWFDEDVYQVLGDRQLALCVADTEHGTTPREVTAPYGYVRLRRETYDDAELTSWAEWVQRQAWDRAFVFFKHEDAGAGPALAKRFLAIM
ncbi:MAG: DUF72 domain-containing protein [Gemmatimonadota bacterium]|nr:DUF72 domain-containing protein [Gemmatimonadota bacterium]